jgi:Mn2+/Fe2+ NRAMP family transporter
VSNLLKVALGILTSVGGYLEVGSLGTALQAGALFRYSLLWALALGTICIAFLTEMTGRLAAVSQHTVVDAVRKRFGVRVQMWPFLAQVIVDLFVLASEVGGASLALQLATGVSIQVWVVPVAALIWALLWFGTFEAIEHGVAVLGLVTLSFVVAAVWLHPNWRDVMTGLIPHRPPDDPAQYAYLAVGILGATISPYLFSFYSSGAIEEQWKPKDLMPNRIVATLGMGFGSLIAISVVIVAALVLAPRGISAESYQQAATTLSVPLGRWGFTLFCLSLGIGCAGAALEIALDLSYIVAQTFGWDWGESTRPANEARFAMTYTAALAIATIPSLAGIDPLKLTMFSMASTVVVLPILVGPLVVVMNDKQYLKQYTNGIVTNTAVVLIIALAFLLAIIAIPVQLLGA